MASNVNAITTLSPEQDAVFDAIVEQCIQSKGDSDGVITYNTKIGQEYLNQTGLSVKLGIDRTKQLTIIREMTEAGIIDADWIIPDVANPCKYVLARGADWAEEKFGIDVMLLEDDDCERFCYINLSFDRIKTINETLRRRYSATLSYVEKKEKFVVSSDNGTTMVLKKIKNGMPPFEVLRIAVCNPGSIITRDDIDSGKYGRGIHIGKKSIATQVFDDKSIVRNEISAFVKLTNESICVTRTVELTSAQLSAINKVSF